MRQNNKEREQKTKRETNCAHTRLVVWVRAVAEQQQDAFVPALQGVGCRRMEEEGQAQEGGRTQRVGVAVVRTWVQVDSQVQGDPEEAGRIPAGMQRTLKHEKEGECEGDANMKP